MPKIIYLGKKDIHPVKRPEGFKLDKRYKYQQRIKPGEVFELEGDDLLLMAQCMTIDKAADGGSKAFRILDEYRMEEAMKKVNEKKLKKHNEAEAAKKATSVKGGKPERGVR